MSVSLRCVMFRIVTTCGMALAAISVLAQTQTNAPVKKATPPGHLSDAQIEKLVAEYTDPGNKKIYSIMVSASRATIPAADKKKYEKSGKVPFRVICQVVERKDENDTKPKLYTSSSANFYLLDADGKTAVNKQTVSLGKMCPS